MSFSSHFIINLLVKSSLLMICLLILISFFILFERNFMGHLQRRVGPSNVGLFGLLQPLADGLKLFLKETILPININKYLFIYSPIFMFFLALILWLIVPFFYKIYILNLELSLFFIIIISSLNIYSIIFSGWSSNSNYSFLGCLRSVSQMISYEISFSFILIIICLISQSFNLIYMIEFQRNNFLIFILFPIFILFFISILAETNRHPFDLPEAESELVSGYNTEYSSMVFGFFFLSEYSNILFMSILSVIFFFGGWNFFKFESFFIYSFKIIIVSSFFIIFRSILPRYRFDQLIEIGWLIIFPLSLFFFIFYFYLLKFFLLNFYVNIDFIYNF